MEIHRRNMDVSAPAVSTGLTSPVAAEIVAQVKSSYRLKNTRLPQDGST